jgi:hypothetical protein
MRQDFELIKTPERLEQLWPQIEPMLHACIEDNCHGELTVEDLKQITLLGRAYMFVAVTETGRVTLAISIEFIPFPRLKCANVIAMAGEGLFDARKRFWAKLTGWLYMQDVRAIDAWVGERMRKVLTRRLGFKQVYHHVRFDLGE